MARKPRFFLKEFPQHIIQRGNNRQRCFLDEQDFSVFLQILTDVSARYRVDIHSFVLMSNHTHLLASGNEEQDIPGMMQALGSKYVRYFNKKYQRSGTLWEGRYKSCLVASDKYFLTVSRYIELNPVRAGMVDSPDKYAWSSYRFNALGAHNPLLREHEKYLSLGQTKKARIDAYRLLFLENITEVKIDQIRKYTNKGWLIGTSQSKEYVESVLGEKFIEQTWGGDRRSKISRGHVSRGQRS